MKKSTVYRLAQASVLKSEFLPVDDKLEILRELMHREDMEEIHEQMDEKRESNV